MKTSKFNKGEKVRFNTKRNGMIEGVISCIDTNICTFEIQYDVDYIKEGKTWTMIGVPESVIEIA